MFYVELLIEEKSLGLVFEQLLNIADDDSNILKAEKGLIRAFKKYNYIRKMELYRGSFTKELEILFESLVEYEKYPQAFEIGEELAHRYENEKNHPPEKFEYMLKKLISISSNNEQRAKYNSKLNNLYMKDNNLDNLQLSMIENLTYLVDDTQKRELFKSGLNELMFIFKLQFQSLKDDTLKQVNGLLEGKNLYPIELQNKPTKTMDIDKTKISDFPDPVSDNEYIEELNQDELRNEE